MMAFPLRRAALMGAALAAALCLAPPQGARAAATAALHAEEIVRFPSRDADLTGAAPTMLTGRFLRPAGSGPHPAVVLLHGCGGLYAANGRVSPRHLDWALTLRRQGYAVLMVDSFGPRGIDQVCTRRDRSVRATVERKRDAFAALAYLQQRRDVDNGRIAVMGWSQGAGTVLAAYGPGGPGDGTRAGFRAAVAFYPGCGKPLKDESWQPEGPLLMLLGEKDDWTPPEPCIALAERESVRERTELVVYPGAYHGFDTPRSPVRVRGGLATAPGGEAHVGTDEAARADAIARVSAFLEQMLKN